MSQADEWLQQLQDVVDEANSYNLFYLASLSEYRSKDAEEASQAEMQKALENVEHDRASLNAKLKEAQAMANHLNAEFNENIEIASKIAEILSEVPEEPNNDDMKVVSLDSFDDDFDVSSDEDESMNESKAQQMNQFEEIVEMLKDLREQENEIQELEDEKSTAKNEMFEARERGENTKSSQELQKFYFDTIKEFKDSYEKQKKDIRRRIQSLLPKAGEFLKDNLLFTLDQLDNVTQRPIKSPLQSTANALPLPSTVKTPSKFSTKLPQRGKSLIAKPSTADPRIAQEIERHKSKIARATNIKQHGNLRNLQTTEQWPRVIPQNVVQERQKQHSNVPKIAIGKVKKVGIRPSLGAPSK
jgi:hypothetical protein